MTDEHHPSPVDLPGEPNYEGHPLAWTTGAIAVAALFLALFNATSIRSWAVELPPTAINMQVVAAAEQWEGITEAIGIAAPRAFLHARWKDLQALRFGGQGEAAE